MSATGTLLAAPGWLPGWLHWFYWLGRWITDELLPPISSTFSVDVLRRILLFVVLVALSYALGRWISRVLQRSVLRPPRVDLALGRAAGRAIVFVVVLLGFSAGITLFGTSIAAIATGLGLLTVALGFGMQNTVANLVGGVSLALDKPFRPADRIRIGDYWGTVEQIGLRSTRILTPRKELVVVPNKILEEQAIWNYTVHSPEWRLEIDVGVSYASDWRLAERIMLEAAQQHPNILHYRPSQVLMRNFGESAVGLQLRCWVADVTQRAETMSDLLKAIKDGFDAQGVEIPYPTRTVEFRRPGTLVRKPPLEPFSRSRAVSERILVAVSDAHSSDERGVFVASLAKAMGSGIIGLSILYEDVDPEDGEIALRALGEAARNQRLWFKPVVRRGPVVDTIVEAAREEDVGLVLVGSPRVGLVGRWRRTQNLTGRLRQELSRPILTIPPSFRVTPEIVQEAQERIKAYRASRAAAGAPTREPEPANPS